MRDSMRWAPKFMLRGIWGSKYVLYLHHTIVRMFLSLIIHSFIDDTLLESTSFLVSGGVLLYIGIYMYVPT